MRSIHPLAVGLFVLAVAACATETPGWTYAPASPSSVPSVDPSASAAPSGSVAPSASIAPSTSPSPAPSATGSAPASGGPSQSTQPGASAGTTVAQLSAQNIAFDKTELGVPADQPFQIEFANNDAGVPHNVEIKDTAGASLFQGEVFSGIATQTYDAPPLPAGAYQFICTVHPNMVGTLTAQ